MKFLWKKLIAGFASLLLLLTPMTAFASAADFTSIVDTSAPIHSVALQPGDTANVTVNLSISGRQDGTATLKVYQDWTLSGGVFVGSNPKEITVGPRPQGAAVSNLSYNASITVKSGQAAGTFELLVAAFDITNSNITGGKLAAGSSASYTVTIETPVAPVDKTAPTLTIPADRTVEATDVLTPVDIGSATATDDSGYASITNNAPSALTFPLGTTSVIWTAEDASGNVATATEYITIVDTTAPTLTAPASITAIVGAPINLGQAAAHDIFLAAVTNDAPEVFPLGVTMVTWTATDTSGNVTTATQTVTVHYDFKGILQPINPDGSSVFKAGSTVPVKFQLKNASGQYVSTAVASLTYQKVNSTVTSAVNEAVSTSAAGINNYFRYDATSNQYVFNLSTKGMAAGAYRLTITLDDGTTYSAVIGLK